MLEPSFFILKEILQKEIDGTKHHLAELQQEVDVLQEDKNDLRELYEYEEKILGAKI